MNKRTFYLIALMAICFMVVGNGTAKETIKLGIMATKGSVWGQAVVEMNAKLREKSHGQLELNPRFDIAEGRLVQRIRTGSFDVVSLTASGLGDILPEAFIFPLPLLFQTHEELDYVRAELTQRFEQKLKDKGYILLGWVDFGFIYLFSTTPVRTQTDFQRTRFWAWDLDPIAKAFVSASGKEPIVLPIQSVLSSLKKGDIQTVYNSPLACIALGWHTQVNYMSDLRLAAGVGATIVKKRRYDKLSDEHKALLREITWKYHEKLVKTVRRKNKESIDVLEQQGIEVIHVPLGEREKWRQTARQVQNQFEGKLYPKELLDEVRSLLNEYNARR